MLRIQEWMFLIWLTLRHFLETFFDQMCKVKFSTVKTHNYCAVIRQYRLTSKLFYIGWQCGMKTLTLHLISQKSLEWKSKWLLLTNTQIWRSSHFDFQLSELNGIYDVTPVFLPPTQFFSFPALCHGASRNTITVPCLSSPFCNQWLT